MAKWSSGSFRLGGKEAFIHETGAVTLMNERRDDVPLTLSELMTLMRVHQALAQPNENS